MRILVRAGELRCRDDWGKDKWQERQGGDQVLGVVMSDPRIPLPYESTPVPRRSPEIPGPVTYGLTAIGSHQPVEAETENRTVSGDLNSELLRTARERFRERNQKTAYRIQDSQLSQDLSEPLVISNQVIPPSGETIFRATRGETSSTFKYQSPSSGDAFDAVPDVDMSAELPHASRFAQASEDSKDVTAWLIPPPVQIVDEVAFDTSSADHATRHALADESFAAEARALEIAESPERHRSRPREELDHWDLRPVTEDDLVVTPGFDEYLDDAFDKYPASGGEQFALPPEDVEPVWAGIARCCHTCRDFRPAADGTRGWCNNEWAFKHRRMVDADARPCETSIGHWWIPGDNAWQRDYDMSVLGQPTPLMDKWFGRPGADDELEERSFERRRRRS